MPLFDYKCECGAVNEVLWKVITPSDDYPCPCGKMAQRQVSMPAAVFMAMPSRQLPSAADRGGNARLNTTSTE